jgi:hypothetical protein
MPGFFTASELVFTGELCARKGQRIPAMNTLCPILFSFLIAVVPSFAQQPAKKLEIPENLKAQFAIIQRNYPKVEMKRAPKPPADSVWQFRAENAATGTLDVGFQGEEVIYMIFRRGAGGAGWKHQEIRTLHEAYYPDLLKEKYVNYNGGDRYLHVVAPEINAGIITRKGFDTKTLLKGSQ